MHKRVPCRALNSGLFVCITSSLDPFRILNKMRSWKQIAVSTSNIVFQEIKFKFKFVQAQYKWYPNYMYRFLQIVEVMMSYQFSRHFKGREIKVYMGKSICQDHIGNRQGIKSLQDTILQIVRSEHGYQAFWYQALCCVQRLVEDQKSSKVNRLQHFLLFNFHRETIFSGKPIFCQNLSNILWYLIMHSETSSAGFYHGERIMVPVGSI